MAAVPDLPLCTHHSKDSLREIASGLVTNHSRLYHLGMTAAAKYIAPLKPGSMLMQCSSRSFCRDYGWSPEKLLDVYTDFLWNSPEIFFVAKTYHSQWSFNPDGTIVSFYITNLLYSIRKEEYNQAKRILDAETAKAMKLLDGVDDPVKKALILHDHIIRVCEYDVETLNNSDLSPLARTAYSVLVRHLAVCEGYTMAYRYLLNRAGIRSEEVLSEKMTHCWNYLYLNGNWYHVDVTWDDPVYHGRKPDNTKISHEYFLLSDEKITSKEHYDWSVRGLPPASDTQFDGTNWNSY